MRVTRFYVLIGTTIGSYSGWWLGARFGLMTAFILGVIGTGIGFYFGRRIAQHYQP
ncbi:MAG TPA: hypothetical protein VHM24_12695 [Gemmatimonadaceae bacterium]|nr:hypothetical protein [Gemmatimonadaceae bacterium]